MGKKYPQRRPTATNIFAAKASQTASKVDTHNRTAEPIYHKSFEIAKIKLLPSQVRDRDHLSGEESTIDEMGDSMAEFGLLNPILLRQVGNDYFLVSGERRYHGALKKGWTHIAATSRVMSDEEFELVQIHENIHRKNLTQADMARALQRAKAAGQDIDAILKKWGKTRVWASKIQILLDETPQVQRAIREKVTNDQSVLNTVKQVAKNDPVQAEVLVDELKQSPSNQRQIAENALARVKAEKAGKALTPQKALDLLYEQLAKGDTPQDAAISFQHDKSNALKELEQIFNDARTQGAAGLMRSLKSKEFAADGAGAIRLAAHLSGMTEKEGAKFSLMKALALVKP